MSHPSALSLSFLLFAAGLAVAPSAAARGLGWHADALAVELAGVDRLPSPPDGVAELKFSDFFKSPAGPLGLEPTATLRALDGRRVRLLGFMVRQARPSPGVAILAPFALATNEYEYGLADDFPPNVVFVEVPRFADLAVPFTPGPLLLTGTLELGRREEPDGRVSLVRLRLDDEPAGEGATLAAAP
ncbi:MAG TPA: hypothetical protein VK178_05710 [Opitutaceae bacterium]|nr:hypothetical protein [Opitutaceae bacterium]